jgi:hypothetical protein
LHKSIVKTRTNLFSHTLFLTDKNIHNLTKNKWLIKNCPVQSFEPIKTLPMKIILEHFEKKRSAFFDFII